MIKLDIQPYCRNCPDFEAKTDHECLEFSGMGFNKTAYEHRYVITCRNKKRCEEMVTYLRQQRL